jgi:hypothetical protein
VPGGPARRRARRPLPHGAAPSRAKPRAGRDSCRKNMEKPPAFAVQPRYAVTLPGCHVTLMPPLQVYAVVFAPEPLPAMLPPPPSRTNWTRLVPPSVLNGHVSSQPGNARDARVRGERASRARAVPRAAGRAPRARARARAAHARALRRARSERVRRRAYATHRKQSLYIALACVRACCRPTGARRERGGGGGGRRRRRESLSSQCLTQCFTGPAAHPLGGWALCGINTLVIPRDMRSVSRHRARERRAPRAPARRTQAPRARSEAGPRKVQAGRARRRHVTRSATSHAVPCHA